MYWLLAFNCETFISFNTHYSPMQLGLGEIKGLGEIEHFVHGHWVCKENSQDLNEPTGSQPAFSALQTLGDGTLGWGPEFHLCISPTRACLNRIGGMYQTPLRILGGSGHTEQQLDIP